MNPGRKPHNLSRGQCKGPEVGIGLTWSKVTRRLVRVESSELGGVEGLWILV